MRNKKNDVFYQLTTEDIQNVADQELDRELTPEEIKLIENRVGDYISWYDAIALAINELIISPEHKQ